MGHSHIPLGHGHITKNGKITIFDFIFDFTYSFFLLKIILKYFFKRLLNFSNRI